MEQLQASQHSTCTPWAAGAPPAKPHRHALCSQQLRQPGGAATAAGGAAAADLPPLPPRCPCLVQDFMGVPVSMGTTIMAASFDGGVVMGADSRTSTGDCACGRLRRAALRLGLQ